MRRAQKAAVAACSGLQSTPGVTGARMMSAASSTGLLAPWLGADVAQLALPVPAVITATWQGAENTGALAARLQKIAPGTLVSTGSAWAARVASLTASLQACAAAVLVIVALVAAAVVAVATRAGLAQRREAIEIIHGLGALDADIAASFAARAILLTSPGRCRRGAGVAGAGLARGVGRPVRRFGAAKHRPGLPPALWISLPALPLAAAASAGAPHSSPCAAGCGRLA